jgi:hypothetical protein
MRKRVGGMWAWSRRGGGFDDGFAPAGRLNPAVWKTAGTGCYGVRWAAQPPPGASFIFSLVVLFTGVVVIL